MITVARYQFSAGRKGTKRFLQRTKNSEGLSATPSFMPPTVPFALFFSLFFSILPDKCICVLERAAPFISGLCSRSTYTLSVSSLRLSSPFLALLPLPPAVFFRSLWSPFCSPRFIPLQSSRSSSSGLATASFPLPAPPPLSFVSPARVFGNPAPRGRRV